MTVQNFGASKDAFVSSANPTLNYGTANYLMSITTRKGLLQFDLSSIPSVAVCNSAILSLYQMSSGAALAWTVTVYAIAVGNTNWPEGNKNGGAGGAGDCCWNFKDQGGAGTAWAGGAGLPTAGIDYLIPALGTFSGDRSEVNGTKHQLVLPTATVKTWFGAVNLNYGLLLITNNAVGGLASKEHVTPAWWPTLTVEWRRAYAPLRRIR